MKEKHRPESTPPPPPVPSTVVSGARCLRSLSFVTCSQSPSPSLPCTRWRPCSCSCSCTLPGRCSASARSPRCPHMSRGCCGAATVTAAVLSIRSRESSLGYPRVRPHHFVRSPVPPLPSQFPRVSVPSARPTQHRWLSAGARAVSVRVVFVFVSLLCGVVCVFSSSARLVADPPRSERVERERKRGLAGKVGGCALGSRRDAFRRYESGFPSYCPDNAAFPAV